VLLANFPLAIGSFYTTVNQIRKKLAYIIVQAFATSALTIGIGYWLLGRIGLVGIGIAYTLANLIVALVVAMPLWQAVREAPVGGGLAAGEVTAAGEVVPAKDG